MRILVADDRSKDAQGAISLLLRIGVPQRSDVFLLHVSELQTWPMFSTQGRAFGVQQQIDLLREQATQKALASLRTVQEQFVSAGLRAHPIVAEGLPVEEILSAIDRHEIDLAVLGSRGLSAAKRFLLGSVSDHVLNNAPCSLLISRGRPGRTARSTRGRLRVLVAVDASAQARAAVQFLQSLTLPQPTVVTLFHVIDKRASLGPQVLGLDRLQSTGLLKEAAHVSKELGLSLLEGIQDQLAQSDWDVNTRLVTGHPAEEIIKAAAKCKAHLIVLGARGMSKIDRLLLGSVSRKVAHHAPCSVLIVRTNRGQKRNPAPA